MTGVFGRDVFPAKHVAQVRAACIALYFGAEPILIWNFFHCARERVIECRPATACVELIRRTVQLGITSSTDVGAGLIEVIVFPGKRRFGSLVLNDVLLLGGEIIELHAGSVRLIMENQK
jgi:hypothetical protein